MSTPIKIRRDDPRFSFLPAAWAKGPVRFDGPTDIEVVAMSVSRAVHSASLRRTHLFGHVTNLSHVHIAAVMVACYADQICPGDRPAGAGDLLAASAARADRAAVSAPRGRRWTNGVDAAVESILKTRDQEAAILLLTDIMLLALEVLS